MGMGEGLRRVGILIIFEGKGSLVDYRKVRGRMGDVGVSLCWYLRWYLFFGSVVSIF